MKKFLVAFLLWCISSIGYAQTGGTTPCTWVRNSITYDLVTNSYATILTNVKPLQLCIFTNATNAALSWSDGTNPISENQVALSKEFYDLASNRRDIRTNIQVKYTVGAPTVGNVYVNCCY